MNPHLMRSAHLLATDSSFQRACRRNPENALAQRGIILTGAELRAFCRVWEWFTRQGENELPFPTGRLGIGDWY